MYKRQDEYNKALVEMCQEKGRKFLNSAEVLKDAATGYAQSGYVEQWKKVKAENLGLLLWGCLLYTSRCV